MFHGARNFVVQGGSFVVNADSSQKTDISQLIGLVSTNAILNAGGRADEVRCFPGTREEVIGKVEKWMSSVKDGSCKNRIMWLSGPAGAGKSAICQTVAERCPAIGQKAINFFFFRGDQTRNTAQRLVPTLVYQLRDFYTEVDELVTNCLRAYPLIFETPIEDQFLRLISFPMQTIHQFSSPPAETIVIFIDGLDECNGRNERDDSRVQDQILLALRALADAENSPFLILVASRAEPHLIMSFNRLGTPVESIFLDEQYRPRDDIYRFVTAKFEEIKQVHHLRHMLSNNWPTESDIEAITDKSSGQFIYAATVMRFIQYSPESPNLSLVIILEMQPSTTAAYNPLAQLDAVYSYIFSKVRDYHSVKVILCTYLIVEGSGRSGPYFPEEEYQGLLELIGYGPVEVMSLFANLVAIIQITQDPLNLVFYHASLHDYLKDNCRSGDYHVNVGQIAADFVPICLRNFHNHPSFVITTKCLRYVNEATSELSESLLEASTHRLPNPPKINHLNWAMVPHNIERLYFKEDRRQFKILLRRWLHFAYVHNVAPEIGVRMQSSAATRCFDWCRFVEWCRFVLKLKE